MRRRSATQDGAGQPPGPNGASPASSTTSSSAEPQPGTIGQPGAPIRVLAFAGGGFEAARQLGVAHALLVSRGRPPDLVIGTSVGAVSAVAVAEILQAGNGTEEERVADRVARFREIFEAYQNCPGDLADEMFPDTYQIDVQRPLEQVRLPIHSSAEREQRGLHLQSRAGMINLYNDLLRVRVSIATATRFIRRYLGFRSVGAEPRLLRRWTWLGLELLRGWALLGYHLPELAPLAWLVFHASLGKRFTREKGAPAAHLIFRSQLARRAGRAAIYLYLLAVLVTLWMLFSTPLMMLGGIVGHELASRVEWLPNRPNGILEAVASLQAKTGLSTDHLLGLLYELCLAVIGVLVLTSIVAVGSAALRRNSRLPELLGIMGSAIGFVALYGVVSTAVAFWVYRAWQMSSLVLWGTLGIIGFLILSALVGAASVLVCAYDRHLTRNLLKRYDLANGLGNNYPLRQFFVRLFDREFYGRIPMDTVLERAMGYSDKEHDAGRYRSGKAVGKRLDDYTSPRRSPPIHVAITAADVGATPGSVKNPTVQVLPDQTPVVDALLAATAVTPYLPPCRIEDRLFLDASNLANEPTGAALDYLKRVAHPKASAAYLYSVTHLPLTARSLEYEKPERYSELLNVASRARELERFRDARLDRSLTEVVTATLPPGTVHYKTGEDTFLRAHVFPIEPERPAHVNQRVLQAACNADRRRIIAETVADGCRTALETMLPTPVRSAANGKPTVVCRRAVAELVKARRRGETERSSIPGGSAREEDGPGLVEVCQHCVMNRGTEHEVKATLSAERAAAAELPDWPTEHSPETVKPKPARVKTDIAPVPGRHWPVQRALQLNGAKADLPGHLRPTVSFLFSGGVFRGVYQMGALNALNEAGVKPDIIAGASVGSITAAMIARTFTEADTRKRQGRIARLAAVYLGVDRLVMTDRFADFIRAVTVRAAQTHFSIRDADRVFRRYDNPLTGVYERQARRVMAGLERLCYVSPFELKDLVEASRLQDTAKADRLVRRYIQEWLNRMGVSNQVLGADPLRLLIEKYVLDQLPPEPGIPDGDARFDVFQKKGICLLATVTCLTGGHLEVLGQDQLNGSKHTQLLVEGLLASSAFPGVFRPRWAWEIMPTSRARHRYIDGGVTDNLPLDAVAEFLSEAARTGWISRRPVAGGERVPHLLLATSLEPRLGKLGDLSRLENDWPRLRRRANVLKYNLKLDVFAEAQRDLRTIVETRGSAAQAFTPLDLEVLAVKPTWLCPTFAFHPMMGFRRKRQAQSIAHGCRTTLIELGRLYHGEARQAKWADAWGLDSQCLPGHEVVNAKPPPVRLEMAHAGDCWIRPGKRCPFSRNAATEALKESPDPDRTFHLEQTANELDRVYQLCGQAATHEPAKDDLYDQEGDTMTTPMGKPAPAANSVVNVDTANISKFGVFTTPQSLVTFPGAVAAVTTIWKVLGAMDPSLGENKTVPIVLSLAIGTIIYLISVTKGTTRREKLAGFSIAVVNSATIAAAALGIR